jgi:imidazolonepropionase-like amidohydrolase
MTLQRPLPLNMRQQAPTTEPQGIPEKIIKPWKLPPQRTYVLKNANVVDPVDGKVLSSKTVRLSKGLVEAVGDELAVSSDDIVIDLDGRYICPGLIDCHCHVEAVAGDATLEGAAFGSDLAVSHFRQPFLCRQILSRGFTTLRDTGGATLALKEAIEDDVFPGPRLFISNRILSQSGGHCDFRDPHDDNGVACCHNQGGMSVVVDGVPECIRAARDQLRKGASFLKITASGGVASPSDRLENTQFTRDEIRAIVEVAESYGTYVTAHAYTNRAIRHAVDNGVRGIEHGNFLDADTAALMAARGVWLTPTLVCYDAMGSDKYAGFLPPSNQAKNRAVLNAGLDSLRIAHAAGVVMCHGTDLLGPLQEEQSREFGIRAQALSSKTILQGATVNPARMIRQEDFLGQIKPGFAADLLILNRNPLDDISILDEPKKNILAVIKNGRVYTSRWSKLPEDVSESEALVE